MSSLAPFFVVVVVVAPTPHFARCCVPTRCRLSKRIVPFVSVICTDNDDDGICSAHGSPNNTGNTLRLPCFSFQSTPRLSLSLIVTRSLAVAHSLSLSVAVSAPPLTMTTPRLVQNLFFSCRTALRPSLFRVPTRPDLGKNAGSFNGEIRLVRALVRLPLRIPPLAPVTSRISNFQNRKTSNRYMGVIVTDVVTISIVGETKTRPLHQYAASLGGVVLVEVQGNQYKYTTVSLSLSVSLSVLLPVVVVVVVTTCLCLCLCRWIISPPTPSTLPP